MNYDERIERRPNVAGGEAVIKGTRVTLLTEYGHEPVSTLKPMVLHLSQALEGKLTAAASRRGVSIEALAHEMLERALDYDDWFIGEVESGLAQAETGQALTHEAFGARLSKKLAEYDSGR